MKLIYNREKDALERDNQYGGYILNFLYNTIIGRIILKFVINPIFSEILGVYNKTFVSKIKIKHFVKKYKINLEDYEQEKYKSFNDFFIRKKIKLNIDKKKQDFISPADSKLLVYKIKKNLKINIKNNVYSIKELIEKDEDYYQQFKNGNCLIFRLSMDDYHRYCFIDDGIMTNQYYLKGKLHTVNSLSKDYKIYAKNSRICNFMNTENFGNIIFIEVGALLVGKINNRDVKIFKKGEEKGYFELGGSTIVILTQNNIEIDKDILENSSKQIETKIKYGERVGKKLC